MKRFENPTVEVEKFQVEDVVTDSTGGENDLPLRPGN